MEMNTSHSIKPAPTLYSLLQEFAELKSHPTCSVQKVVTWIVQNIQNLEWFECNTISRSLDGNPSYRTSAREEDGKVFIDAEVQIEYADNGDASDYEERREPPRVGIIASLLPDVGVSTDSSSECMLRFTLSLDPVTWPALALSTLYDKLHFSMVSTAGRPRDRKEALDHATLILKHLYPAVSLDLVHTAHDLGMLDDKDVFLGWISQGSQQLGELSLPTDISITS